MKKKNLTFSYLYALAIIMVIDDHVGMRVGILNGLFPYNSFYMPLFVFCSGYFYQRTSIRTNICHKTRKLFVPYMGWNLVGILIAGLLDLCSQNFLFPAILSLWVYVP